MSGMDDSYLILGRMPTVRWHKGEGFTCIWSGHNVSTMVLLFTDWHQRQRMVLFSGIDQNVWDLGTHIIDLKISLSHPIDCRSQLQVLVHWFYCPL